MRVGCSGRAFLPLLFRGEGVALKYYSFIPLSGCLAVVCIGQSVRLYHAENSPGIRRSVLPTVSGRRGAVGSVLVAVASPSHATYCSRTELRVKRTSVWWGHPSPFVVGASFTLHFGFLCGSAVASWCV